MAVWLFEEYNYIKSLTKGIPMLATIAVILLVIWGAGLALHLLGGFIHIVLVVAVILGIMHFMKGKSAV